MLRKFLSSLIPHRSSPLSWSLPYDPAPLKARLAALDAADPLYPLLLGFLDSTIVVQAETRVSPDAGAHQFVGRQNAVSELRGDLERLWAETHQKKG